MHHFPSKKPFQVGSVTAVQFKAVIINSFRVSGGKLQFKQSHWHYECQKMELFHKCNLQCTAVVYKCMFFQFVQSLPQIVCYFQAWCDQTYGWQTTYSLILITHFGPCFKLTFSSRKVTWPPDTIRATDIWDAFIRALRCCEIARQLERNLSLSFKNEPYKSYSWAS